MHLIKLHFGRNLVACLAYVGKKVVLAHALDGKPFARTSSVHASDHRLPGYRTLKIAITSGHQ